MVDPIINIFKSLEEALYFKNSQINTQFIFSGVQLLPNNPNKYIQVTNTPNGINLEDWVVKVMSICGNELGDITPSFMVESLTNSTNGNPQFVWSLKNIPIDFGWGLVYLKITQTVGDTFYTQPFKITSIGEEKTAQITYRYKRKDEYQSIGFAMWFREDDIKLNLTKYYEVSTESSVNSVVETNLIETWKTELVSRHLIINLVKILKLPYVYINKIRANLYEAPELSPSNFRENFGSIDLSFSFNKNDVFKEAEGVSGDFLDSDWVNTDFLIYT